MDIGVSPLNIMNNKQFYIKTKNGKIGPLNYDDLFRQELSHNSKIWFTGAADWEKLRDIPELKEIFDSIPPATGTKVFKTRKIVIGFLIIVGLCLGLNWFYSQYSVKDKDAPKILTIEETNNKFSSGVFLIRHEYAFKISIGGEDYYFNEYDKETGEISKIKTLEEVTKEPIVIWGTGFLIDSLGRILTCRHIVDVKPSDTDMLKIKERLKDIIQDRLLSVTSKRNYMVNYYNQYYNNTSDPYFVDTFYTDQHLQFRSKIDSLEIEMESCRKAISDINSPTLVVTKKTFLFGIFKNGFQSSDFSDPIECKSTKLSEDINIDLAIIEPINGIESLGNIKPVSLSRLNDPEKRKLNLDEPLRMIGYNDGLFLAKTSSGIKSQITEGRVTQNDDQYKILYSIASLPGSSGSPILDQYGNLVSVNFAGRRNSQSFNFGISPYFVYQFIKM